MIFESAKLHFFFITFQARFIHESINNFDINLLLTVQLRKTDFHFCEISTAQKRLLILMQPKKNKCMNDLLPTKAFDFELWFETKLHDTVLTNKPLRNSTPHHFYKINFHQTLLS